MGRFRLNKDRILFISDKDLLGCSLNRLKRVSINKKRDYSSVMVDIPKGDIRDYILDFGKAIPDKDLSEDGREDLLHVTVLYGLHTNIVSDIKGIINGVGDIEIELGESDIFPADEVHDFDVVKFNVKSKGLGILNSRLKDLDFTNKYEYYKPHITVAYVKSGKGSKYVGDKSLVGEKLLVDKVVFSDLSNRKYFISLNGKSKDTGLVGMYLNRVRRDSKLENVEGSILKKRITEKLKGIEGRKIRDFDAFLEIKSCLSDLGCGVVYSEDRKVLGSKKLVVDIESIKGKKLMFDIEGSNTEKLMNFMWV